MRSAKPVSITLNESVTSIGNPQPISVRVAVPLFVGFDRKAIIRAQVDNCGGAQLGNPLLALPVGLRHEHHIGSAIEHRRRGHDCRVAIEGAE